MINPKVFCPECRQDVQYNENKSLETAELKGEAYTFLAHAAHCVQCGAEVYVEELEDANLKALYDAYRQRNGIISLEKVREIPKKYNIGNRPLSLMLGWGEQTFSRYYEGDLPSKQYSERLKQLYEDPVQFLALLESSKGKLTDVAFSKSKAATKKLLNSFLDPSCRMEVAVAYLLSQCQDITPLALQKALYYIQGFYYAFHQSYLFAEDCEAWVAGPAYPEIYRRYKTYGYNPIEPSPEFDLKALSENERAVFDGVIRHVCCYSGGKLKAFTHAEKPWLLARGDLPANAPSNRIIPKTSIGDYFVSVKEKYKMLSPVNIGDYMRYLFVQL